MGDLKLGPKIVMSVWQPKYSASQSWPLQHGMDLWKKGGLGFQEFHTKKKP
jgi:hypothetical protein